MKSALLAVLVLAVSTAHAQDLRQFEPVLFPVLSRAVIRGANGTSFQARLVAHAREPITYFPAIVDGKMAVGEQPRGTGFVNFFEATGGSAGRLLYLEPSDADHVKFFYQLWITGPDGSMHETTLPVVRERDLLRGSSALVGLRTEPIYDFTGTDGYPPKVVGFKRRNYIRIYDLDNTGNLTVKVRVDVGSALPGFILHELDVNVVRRDGEGPSYPYYATIAIPDLCVTAPTGITCRDYGIRVSIDPNDPNTRYYAFASATDHASGETSIFFPQ